MLLQLPYTYCNVTHIETSMADIDRFEVRLRPIFQSTDDQSCFARTTAIAAVPGPVCVPNVAPSLYIGRSPVYTVLTYCASCSANPSLDSPIETCSMGSISCTNSATRVYALLRVRGCSTGIT